MSDFEKQYELWDEFLGKWPISRLSTMTLDEYSKAGSNDSFTHWIESHLDQMGSIWGGSSFKFGVYSRKDTDEKKSAAKLSYSESHGWYSSLGESAQGAFKNVQRYIVKVATMASQGDLDGIEAFEHLGESTKWKIAFHYQNREAPVIVDIFKKAPLATFVGETKSQTMAALQKATIARRPPDLGILEFGRQIWDEWSKKNLVIWKLSHGNPPSFTEAQRQKFLSDQLAVMARDTGKDQGKKFEEAPIGTLFFLCHGNSPQRIGQFISEAMPCPEKGDGWLERKYRLLKTAIRTDRYTNNSKYWSPQGNTTFWQVGADDLPEFDMTLLKPYFGTDLAELAGLAGDPIELSGPVPISKTHLSDEEVLRHFDKKQAFTVFRATWSMQDRTLFCRLARAVHDAGLDWWHVGKGVQVRFGRKEPGSDRAAGVLGIVRGRRTRKISWIRELGDIPELNRVTMSEEMVAKIEAALSAERDSVSQFLPLSKERPGLWPDELTDEPGEVGEDTEDGTMRAFNRIYYGPPGTGKTYALIELLKQDYMQEMQDVKEVAGLVQRYSFVTFHQSYGYEEFVEGLRPILDDGDNTHGQVQYEIRPGVFKELCRRARLAPDQRFAIVIDEINRGNISKIFGELITLIETDKREGAENQTSVILPYSGESFSVPANVDVIGTMNTADRSLALLDTALRRRFDFVPIMPNVRDESGAPLYGLRVTSGQKVIDIPRMLAAINVRIEALYDRDHCIGHAYFTPLVKISDDQERFDALAQIFRNRILPLLEEYFFEDWQKIRLVLADNQKSGTECFVVQSSEHEEDLSRLFGNDHGLDTYSTKSRYSIQDAAFPNPDAYIMIYQTLEV